MSDFFSFFGDLVESFFSTLKIPIGVYITWFLLRDKIRLYLVRDIVVARLKEIQDIKASVRKKIAKEISCFIRNDFKKGSKWVGSSDVTYGARIIKEISDESFHAERGLATLTYLSEYVFSGIEAEVKGSLEEGIEINRSRMSKCLILSFRVMLELDISNGWNHVKAFRCSPY